MLGLVVLGFVPGVILGIRFRVSAMALVCVIGGANILAVALLAGAGLQASLLSMAAACVALQVGYVVGSLIRFVPVVDRYLRARALSDLAANGGEGERAAKGPIVRSLLKK
jgi:hypothetical protein